MSNLLASEAFSFPKIALAGTVDYEMYNTFRSQLANTTADDELVVVQISTLGGDPEVARLMGEAVRFESQLSPKKRIVFLGAAYVYSAGATFMSFFSRENRYLTRGTRLMVHERRILKSIALDGPLTMCIATVEATLNEIRASIAIQNEGFANLALGSTVSVEEIKARAPSNWYIDAEDALRLGLVESVL